MQEAGLLRNSADFRSGSADSGQASRKREANYKLSVRIPLGYVNMAEFRQQLIEMGYCNFTAWVLRCIRRQQEEYKKRKAPAKDGSQSTTTTIQDKGRDVK